ncbi:MAG: 6-carboxytetrahydropterin synthase [Thermoguttaceae bacterium]|nr:6-carboxytetrahydropterin synthase [Thermoguttaceae bacterium]
MISRERVKYSVILDDSALIFKARHALALPDFLGAPFVEPLHEHEFRARLKISGSLDESACVVDFVAARRVLLEVLAELNDRTIVATDSPSKGTPTPAEKVVSLEATNPSTEEIAFWALDRFVSRFSEVSKRNPEEFGFALRLEEAPGCFAEAELPFSRP